MNILIINLHSALNLGDAAIMQKTLEIINKKFPGAKITLMANHPQSWTCFENVFVVPSLINYAKNHKCRFSIKKITILFFLLFINLINTNFLDNKMNISKAIKSLNEADIVFSCGGGNFYTNTFFAGDFFLNALLILYAGIKKKPIFMLPQSFGPFCFNFHLHILKFCLRYTNIICVREMISYNLLIKNNVPVRKIILVPDLALALSKIINCKRDLPLTNNNLKLGVTIINREKQYPGFNKQNAYIEELIKTIKYILDNNKTNVYLFVQCYGPSSDQNDNIITRSVYQTLRNQYTNVFLMNNYENPSVLIEDISQMDLIIASRMHTAIFGITNYIPTILIGYQPKADGLFRLFDLDKYHIPINGIGNGKLTNVVNMALNNHNVYHSKLKANVPIIKKMIEDRMNDLP
jgi:colanic acid/amylovoran biosynthesis protein